MSSLTKGVRQGGKGDLFATITYDAQKPQPGTGIQFLRRYFERKTAPDCYIS